MEVAALSPPLFTPRAGVESWMRQYQDWLCHRLEMADGGGQKFSAEDWTHACGGGGSTRVLQQGAVLGKGGVAFSAVWDRLSKAAARSLLLSDPRYFAAGISVVQHPRSPRIPISHLNVRYVEAGDGAAWFSGSIDLTPIYVDERQTRWFHEQIREMCRHHHTDYYLRFKTAADNYFYLPHRQETRGVGGLYFDRLMVGRDGLFEELFAFVQDVGEVYGRTYSTLLRQNAHLPYSERERQWQQVRRGRYAEFNLALDHGTRFGLKAGGRPESVLLSLPPQATWHHNLAPEPNSPEATTQQWLRRGVDWLATSSAAPGPCPYSY